MRGLIKTLAGDTRNIATAAICVVLTALLIHTPLAPLAGLTLPITLLAGAAYIAKH